MKEGMLVAILAATLFGNVALAEPSKASGFYLGGAIGVTELEDDGYLADFGFRVDDSDSSIQINAGYKFIPYFAIEARVTDLGDYRVNNGFTSVDLGFDAVSLHAVGIIPFGTSDWELFGQIGLARIDFDVDFACSDCSDETAGSVGIGVRYSPTENIGISAQLDAYAYELSDSFRDYDVGVVTSQVGIQYLF